MSTKSKKFPERHLQSLKIAVERIEEDREAIEESGHHYADVLTEDLAEAINTLSNAIDALQEIADGKL